MTDIDGATLTIALPIGSSSCNRFDHIDIEERGDAVSISAVVEQRSDRPFETVCTGDLRVEAVTVTLEEPLGVRELLGCAPGPEPVQNFFGDVRRGDDCAEIIAG